jgi:outer membrane protein assembly factor BamB
VRWEIGGESLDEPFDRRLAGYYFFGAPTPDRDELFVIGEKGGEIRVFSLNADTGRPNWSQLIAYSDSKIEQDLGRRWWTAQVSVADGLLVCPTTAGWLIGVDRLNRSVVWAHRYTSPESSRRRGDPRAANLVPNTQLNQLWGPSAPVIAGHRVVYTPPDSFRADTSSQPEIVCVDLYDGKPVWQKPKGNFLYLAGVFDERVVLVGSDSLTALSLEEGSTLWSVAVGESRPSGMGVAVENRYYLPLQSGELWAIDLDAGTVISKVYQPEEQGPLGNLGMYQGMLVSLSPEGLTSFEQRDAIVTEIARRKARDPSDAWALLREAEMELLNRKYESALGLLRQVSPEKLAPDLEARYRTAMLQSLAAVIRLDSPGHGAEIEELGRFAETAAERLLHRRFVAEQLQARRDYEAAFDLYLKLLEEQSEGLISRNDVPNTQVRLDCWIAGKLASLWESVPEEQRSRLDERIVRLAEESLESGEEAAERFLTAFAFHPAAARVALKSVARESEVGEFQRAELRLLRLSRSQDEETATAARERLVRLMTDFELPRDAEYFARLAGRSTPDREKDDEPVAAPSPSDAGRVDWGDFELKLEVSGTNYSPNLSRELGLGPSRLPFFRDHRLIFFQQYQRLGVIGPDEEMRWMLPMRTSPYGNSGTLAAQQVGHQVFVAHGGVLHALSPVERRVVWTQPLGGRNAAAVYYRSAGRDGAQPMQSGTAIASRGALRQPATIDGMLAVANSEYVCTYERRTVIVRDALTGEVRWTRSRIPANSALVGNEEIVFIVPPGNGAPTALRAIDGEPLEIDGLGEELGKTVAVVSGGLIQVESGRESSVLGLSRTNLVVRAFDPLRGEEHWRAEFPNNTYFSLLDDDRLAALEVTGRLHVLDLQTGERVKFDALPDAALKYRAEIYALGDYERVYLIVNQSRRRSYIYSSGGLPTLNVNGTIYAFDRRSGRKLWEQKAPNQQLLREQFTHLPVMVFSSRRYERQGNMGNWETSLLVIDKKSGRELIDAQLASQYSGGFQALKLNASERSVELVSYNQRIRLVAKDRDDKEPVEATKTVLAR